ncbi:hypothetical protein ABL78_1265 [Leptomonas seymouri]|uniref:Transmembrane protein n=1 Tax=Leptomonas seymouri TaxID=5684 RepID=A0A0N1IME0_LEPSE|nr:hypothetical protein ABL78_1265 [Leptomonas seymouri]|eukprot:KPI89600.1 hypothetical protein ABL78_1265 [Leptomonas seymouri]
MRSGRQASVNAPSVRTSSSQRSTIETRGIPEFDRDYARQLSVAKRGRSGSVKASPRAGSVAQFPPEEPSIGHFSGSAAKAAAAATRIKDYVATHVTPPLPFQRGTLHVAGVSVSNARQTAGNSAGSPRSAGRNGGSTNLWSTSFLSASTRSATEDGADELNSPPSGDGLNSTRCGVDFTAPEEEASAARPYNALMLALRAVVLCSILLAVLLYASSFFWSSAVDNRTASVSLNGSPQASPPQLFDSGLRLPFLDHTIPLLNFQVALPAQRLLGHLRGALDAQKGVRFLRGMLRSMCRPFIWTWRVLKEGIVSPIAMVLPKVDASTPTVGAVLGAMVRSMMHFFAEPIFIVWRFICFIRRGLTQSIHFSSPMVGPNVSAASPIRLNTTASTETMRRRGSTFSMSRATSSILLTVWRSLHRVWAFVVPLALENPTSSSNYWSAPLRNLTTNATRNLSSAYTKFAEQQERQLHASTPAEKRTEPTARRPTPPKTVRTTHTRLLSGGLWAALLEAHPDKLKQLAYDDLMDVLGKDAVVESLRLRPGSLVIDVVVAQGATPGPEKTEAELQHATQSKRDAWIARGRFSRLHAFYDEEAAKAIQRSDATASAAACAADCDKLVSACHQNSDVRQQQLKRDLHACEETSAEALKNCERKLTAALLDAEATLRDCQAAENACQSHASSCAAKLAGTEKRLEVHEAGVRDSDAALAAAQRALAAATAGYANESKSVWQRCAIEVTAAQRNCSKQIQEVRALLEAEHAKDLEAKRESCESEMVRAGEEKCAGRLKEQEGSLNKHCQLSVRHAEALCTERLALGVDEINRSKMAALKELQQMMSASATDAAQRLFVCEESSRQSKAHWGAERKELQAACITQVAAAQVACGETERQAATEDCHKRLAAQEEELRSSCITAVKQAEMHCRAQLSHDAAAFNSSSAAALAELRDVVDATKRAAEERVAACVALRDGERETCVATQQRLNASCTAQLWSAQQKCDRDVGEKVEAERTAQQQMAQDSWTRQTAVLTTQCSHDTQHAVAKATAELQAQHTAALQEVRATLKHKAEEERKRMLGASDQEREVFRQRHAEELRLCESRASRCMTESRAALTAQENALEWSRKQLFTHLADDGEDACLRLFHNTTGCAEERRKIEARLQALPATATLFEMLSRLRPDSDSNTAASPSTTGHLTWDFRGNGPQSLTQRDPQRGRSSTSWLHVAGTAVGLAFAAYALFRRQRDRRLYKDTIAQLNALIEASRSTTAVRSALPPRPRRGRIGAAAAAFADDAPVSWTVAAACLEHYTDAVVSWHSTCCAVLFEQDSKELLRRHYEAQRSAVSSASQSPSATALGPLPHTSIVSASTIPPTDPDISRAECAPALTQMHGAFLSTYYNILEMYYVDLLNAVANRELAENQLQEVESVASRQAAVLHKQSAAVTQLKRALAEKESTAVANARDMQHKLEKEKRKTAAQQAMIALLEEQLKLSKDELDRRSGVVQTPGPTTNSGSGADSSTTKQVRSLQELADVENNSTNSSDFSDADGMSPQSPNGASPSISQSAPPVKVGQLTHALESRRVPTRAPTSAMKKSASMVRDPESTRRYHKLRWDDVSGGE